MLTIRSLSSLAEPTILFLLLFSLTICHGQKPSPCVPSSCGNIRNITFPFRLKGDPKNCGNPRYELDCQNNHTILNLNSRKYYVQSIDYDSYTIKIVDPALESNNPCAFPLNATEENLSNNIYSQYSDSDLNIPLIFINCLAPVNSSRYVDITFCNSNRTTVTSSNSSRIHSYVVAGDDLSLSDLEVSCSVVMVTRVVRLLNKDDYTSLSSIHEAVINGIELSWRYSLCSDCIGVCRLEENSVSCRPYTVCYEDTPLSKRSFRCKLEYYAPYILLLGVVPVGGLLGLRFLCGFACLMALVVYKRRRTHLWLEYENVEDLFKGQYQFKPIRYSFSQIKKITNNFKDKLGVGGHGTVYKGKLRSGPLVAVKMMDKSMANPQEFLGVVAALGRIQHENVMQLIGFCIEGQKRALVYDFVPNGSLQKHILPREGMSVSLSYENLYEISLGVARGVDYLHRSSYVRQSSHFGIKSHNIFLDENLIPKISDFGLTKLYPRLNYMAPEFYYKNMGEVSHKADVYSFGMLLMEMINGRRKNMHSLADHESHTGLPSCSDNQYHEGKDTEIEDATAEERKMVKKMSKVALWCTQMKPADRPSMSKVLEMLEVDDPELLYMPPAENRGISIGQAQ